MSVDQIITLIGSLGFPIVACIGLFWFINKNLQMMIDSVNKNTEVINRLLDKIGRD